MKLSYAVWLAVAVSVLTGGYLYMRTSLEHKSAGPPEKVTIAYSASPDSALAQVAQAQGYYLKEGLDTVPQKYAYGKVALDAVLEGKADFATVAETPVMFAIMKGEKISIIATIQTSNRNNVIIARKDRGIQAPQGPKGPEDSSDVRNPPRFFPGLLPGHDWDYQESCGGGQYEA